VHFSRWPGGHQRSRTWIRRRAIAIRAVFSTEPAIK